MISQFYKDSQGGLASCFLGDLPSVDFGVREYCLDVVPVFLASLRWSGRLDHSELGKDQRLRGLEVGSDSLDHSFSLFRNIRGEDQISRMRGRLVRYSDDVVSGL